MSLQVYKPSKIEVCRMKMNMYLKSWIMLIAASAAAVASVASASLVHADSDETAVLSVQHGHSEDLPLDHHAKTDYGYRFPLTGLNSNLNNHFRPVVVMVENSSAARPQSGLDQADLVYEVLAEGNITRFVAVYQSKTPLVVGPVRSIRPYLVEIGAGLDGLIVHAGWSQEAMNMITARNLNHFDQVYGDGVYYWRSPERKAPHNLYTSIEKIRQGAAAKHMRSAWNRTGPVFAAAGQSEPEEAAQPVQSRASSLEAAALRIPYPGGYQVSYRYDAATGDYARYMNDEPHLDKETGRALRAVNLLICKAVHRIVDKEGRREVDVTGPGTGYLVQSGTARKVSWEMQDGMIRPGINGRELELMPGQTWVQIVPESAEIEFGEGI
jgi:hypothetical protein